jgi:hypothetical protein
VSTEVGASVASPAPDPVPELGQVRRLPLWRTYVESLLKSGLTYGAKILIVEIEENIGEHYGKGPRFGMAISNMNDVLAGHGMHLSERGQYQKAFYVIPVDQNAVKVQNDLRAISRILKRGTVLLVNTPRELLQGEDLRRLESTAEKVQARLAWWRNADKNRKKMLAEKAAKATKQISA